MSTTTDHNESQSTTIPTPLFLHQEYANSPTNVVFRQLIEQLRELFGWYALAQNIFRDIVSRGLQFFLLTDAFSYEEAREEHVIPFIGRALEHDFDTALRELQSQTEAERRARDADMDVILEDAIDEENIDLEFLGMDTDELLEMEFGPNNQPDPSVNPTPAFVLDLTHANSDANIVLRHLIDQVRSQFEVETIAHHISRDLSERGIPVYIPSPKGRLLGAFEPAPRDVVLLFIRRAMEIGFDAALQEATAAADNEAEDEGLILDLDLGDFDLDCMGV